MTTNWPPVTPSKPCGCGAGVEGTWHSYPIYGGKVRRTLGCILHGCQWIYPIPTARSCTRCGRFQHTRQQLVAHR